jgi:hypothetical protein
VIACARVSMSFVRALAVLAVLLGLAAAAPAAPKRLVARFPRVVLPPGASVEACLLVRLPLDATFDLRAWRVRHHGVGGVVGARHFLVYQYVGTQTAAFVQDTGHVVESRGCLDVGPGDRDARVLVAGARSEAGLVPDGLALPLVPQDGGLLLVLDANWANAGSRPRTVSAEVVLTRAKPGTVRQRLVALREHGAEASLAVPPFDVAATADARWQPPHDVCVLSVSSASHRRGLFVGVDRLNAQGAVDDPSGGVADPFVDGRIRLFGGFDFTDPGTRDFPHGLLVRADGALSWSCWHDNGVNTPVRLGCETVPGATPGSAADGAARVCSAAGPDAPECNGAGLSGACVPANLVAGPDPDDEECALTGWYWDAVPGAADDAACSIGAGS